MDKGPGQLNHAFIKGIIRSMSLCQPELFEHLVRFEKQALIETGEITQIMRVQLLTLAICDQVRYFPALTAHQSKLRRNWILPSLKRRFGVMLQSYQRGHSGPL